MSMLSFTDILDRTLANSGDEQVFSDAEFDGNENSILCIVRLYEDVSTQEWKSVLQQKG